MKELTEQGFADAANELGCEVAAIKAVCEVEAPKGGFLSDGRITILFERHKFHKLSHGEFSKEHPDISNPVAGGYGAAGAHQWDRYEKAAALNEEAAKLSCSWGKFQIMGFNFASAGFESVDDFVDAMGVSEDEQLKAFVRIVKGFGLANALIKHNWAAFAKGYNGANYAINKYDVKLKAAYERHKKDKVVAPAPNVPDAPEALPVPAEADSSTETVTTSGSDEPTEVKSIQMTATSPTVKKITIGMIGTAILGAFQQAWQSSQDIVKSGFQYALSHLPMMLIIIALAALGIWIYNKEQDRRAARLNKIIDINTDKSKHDVLIT